MKLNIKRKLAGFLSVLMFFSIFMGVQGLTLVKAGTENLATISVRFRGESANYGKVQINTISGWEDYVGEGESKEASAVRIVPNQDYEIDWTGIALRVDGSDILTEEIRSSLASDAGYALTGNVAYALEAVEFRLGNGSAGGSGADNDGIEIAFTDGTVDGNVITYVVGDQNVTVTVDGTTVSDSKVNVPRGDEGSVTFTLSNNYDPNTMEVKVYEDEGFRTTLAVVDYVTSLATHDGGLPDSLKLVVTAKGNNEGTGGDGAGNDGIEIAFTDGTVNGNVITYVVGEQNVTVTVNGTTVSDSKVNVPRGDEGSVTFTLSDNYDPDTMEVDVYADDGFCTTLAVVDYVTSLANKTHDGGFPDSLKFVVTAKGTNEERPEPGQGSGATNEFPYPDYTTAALHVTGNAEFFLNGVYAQDKRYDEETGLDIVIQRDSIYYPYDIQSKTVEFEFCTLINERYTSIQINGVDYSSYIPGYRSDENPKTDAEVEAEVLAAIDLNGNNQTTSVILPSVPRADSYTIEVSKKEITSEDSVYWPVGNFLWFSDDVGGEDCIYGGRIELVSVKYQDIFYSDEAGSSHPLTGEDGLLESTCYFSWGSNSNGDGGAVFPYGTELTVRLIPDYGKQLVAFGINGGNFICGESVSTYTFTVARGNFHLNARFEDVADEVSSDGSSEISGGSIVLGENEIDTGSVVLTVKDTTPSSEEKTEFENNADGYTVDAYLDLNLSQVVYKGSRTDYWETDMSTLNSDADISLELSETLAGDDIVVIHQMHDGTYEVIPAQYDADANTVSFSTSSFSKYAIAYKTETAIDDTEYTVVFYTWNSGATVDGEVSQKAVKFRFDKGQDTVKISDLIPGTPTYNGREFFGWTKNLWVENPEIITELSKSDLTGSGSIGDISYENGISLTPVFSKENPQNTGNYYLTLYPGIGKINGKDSVNIVKSYDQFGTVDLSSYIPVKEGCTFKGWFVWDAEAEEYKAVESISSKDFVGEDNLMLSAAWQADTLDENKRHFKLDANGGTIEGSASKIYNLVVNSSADRFIIAYAKPVRDGYTFDGWYQKDAESGAEYKCTYLTWFDFNDEDLYAEVYAKWTKVETEPETTTKPETTTEPETTTKPETTTEPETTTKPETTTEAEKDYAVEIKTDNGNAVFEKELPQGSTLRITEENKELLTNLQKTEKNLLRVFDISVIVDNQVVPVENNKITIRLLLDDTLKGYNTYKVVYIQDGVIKETIDAQIDGNYLMFKTSHLSQYGIVATKDAESTGNTTTTAEKSTDNAKSDVNGLKTGDSSNITLWIVMLFVSCGVGFGITVLGRKKNNTIV